MADEDKHKKESTRQGNSDAKQEDGLTIREVIEQTAREDERPQSRNLTLGKILGGDLLSTRTLRHNIWLIVIIVVFLVIYTANRYSCQRYLIEIDKLNTQLQDVKYKAMSANSQITEMCRESKVIEKLRNNKDSVLKMPNQPPYIINVPKEK